MSSRPDLSLDWCSGQAAQYAVMHWHYSRTMPRSKRVNIGVWEEDQFIGALVFGIGGGNATDGRRYGLARNFEMVELMRVALTIHHAPVSRIVSVGIKLLQRQSPGIRLLVSFADPAQGHNGAIYQAMNWVYTGRSGGGLSLRLPNGEMFHDRAWAKGGWKKQYGRYKRVHSENDGEVVRTEGKHRYLYPLDAEMRARVSKMSQPYPKRAGSIDGDASAFHAGEGGSSPTPALQESTS